MEDAVYAMEKSSAMAAVRAAADELEGLVADDTWPLPTTRDAAHPVTAAAPRAALPGCSTRAPVPS